MFFQAVSEAAPDPIFGLAAALKADARPHKIDLMVGIYKDEHLKSELLSSVRMAKEQIVGQDLMADYLPIDGSNELVEHLGALLFGEEAWNKSRERIYAAHTVGSTGALRAGFEFLAQEVGKAVCLPNFTWPNHRSILERTGCQLALFPYYSQDKKSFDFDAVIAFLEKLPAKTVVLLHGCCHNPTGCDPKRQEWREISLVMKEKKLIPFFDMAYQGLGDGLDEDAEAIRMFLQDGHEMFVAYSCAKNFSMYCHRVGALFVVTESGAVKHRVGSQVKRIIRALYSNPPAQGAWIVNEVLKQPDLRKAWQKDLEGVRHRLTSMRQMLANQLVVHLPHFERLKSHRGMFSFLDLSKNQVEQLIKKFAIYVLDHGRINVAGLTSKNIDMVVRGILAVCAEQ